MDVFERPLEVERALADLRQNRVQALADVFRVARGDDALRGEHRGMRLGRGDVLGKEVPVDVDGDVDFLHDRIGRSGKPPAPHLVAHVLVLMPAVHIHARKRAPPFAG